MDEAEHRYARQHAFQPIGADGQARLSQSRVAIVGVGALGTHVASTLARAGVGFIRLIDRDIVERSNLQRQMLFDEADVSEVRPKAVAAAAKLRAANQDITVDPVVADLTWRNAESLLANVDVIVDGTDNFTTRRLLNDVAMKHQMPWGYGGVVSSYGSSAFFVPGETGCFVCLYGSAEEDGTSSIDTCDTVGVLAPAVAMVAAAQASETLKWLTGRKDALMQGMLHVDVWANQYDVIALPPARTDCPCCHGRHFAALEPPAREALTVSFCGRQTIQVRPEVAAGLALADLADNLRPRTRVRVNENLLQCELDGCLLTVFADGRALVQSTDDKAKALAVYRAVMAYSMVPPPRHSSP